MTKKVIRLVQCIEPLEKEGQNMSIDDKLNKLDDAVTMATTEIRRLQDEIKRHELTLQKIADEIEREADHYDAYVDADIAKGLYRALEIIKKHYTY